MVKKCCVFTCPSESYSGCNVSFHSLPKNEEMRHKWLSSIHVKQRITKNSVVCSRHFEPSSFYNANSRRLLKANAIPTISLVKKDSVKIMSDNNKENNRTCFKCGSSPSVDGIKLFRVLKPGLRNLVRCEQWAKFLFPEQNVSSLEFQVKLYNEHRMVCARHFKDEDFRDSSRKYLLRTAVPCGTQIKQEREDNRFWITDDVEAKEEGISPSQSPTLLAKDNVLESNIIVKGEDETDAEEGTDTEDDSAEKCILCKTKGFTCDTNNDILLSRFPLDPAICLAWVKRVGLKQLLDMPIQKLHDTKFLCQFHFNPGCFIKKGDSLVLRPQAVPSEELCFPRSTDSMTAKFSKDGTETDDYCDVEYLDENTLQCDDGSEAVQDEGGNDKAASNTAQNPPVFDDIDTLFQSYAGTFKKLSCKLQTMLKLDIAKLFARYEIKNLEMEKEKSKAAEIKIQEAPKTKLKKPPPREKAQSKKLKAVTPPKMLYHSIGPTVHEARHSPTIECQTANPVMINITSQQIVPLAAPHQKHSPLATAKECQSIEKPVIKIFTSRQTVTNLEKADNTRNANVSVEPSGVNFFVIDQGQKFEQTEKPSKIRKMT